MRVGGVIWCSQTFPLKVLVKGALEIGLLDAKDWVEAEGGVGCSERFAFSCGKDDLRELN